MCSFTADETIELRETETTTTTTTTTTRDVRTRFAPAAATKKTKRHGKYKLVYVPVETWWGSEWTEVYARDDEEDDDDGDEEEEEYDDDEKKKNESSSSSSSSSSSFAAAAAVTTRLDLTLTAKRDQLGVPAAMEPLAAWMLQRRVQWGFEGLTKKRSSAGHPLFPPAFPP